MLKELYNHYIYELAGKWNTCKCFKNYGLRINLFFFSPIRSSNQRLGIPTVTIASHHIRMFLFILRPTLGSQVSIPFMEWWFNNYIYIIYITIFNSFMKNRKPYQFTKFITFYNIAQVLACCYIIKEVSTIKIASFALPMWNFMLIIHCSFRESGNIVLCRWLEYQLFLEMLPRGLQ